MPREPREVHVINTSLIYILHIDNNSNTILSQACQCILIILVITITVFSLKRDGLAMRDLFCVNTRWLECRKFLLLFGLVGQTMVGFCLFLFLIVHINEISYHCIIAALIKCHLFISLC